MVQIWFWDRADTHSSTNRLQTANNCMMEGKTRGRRDGWKRGSSDWAQEQRDTGLLYTFVEFFSCQSLANLSLSFSFESVCHTVVSQYTLLVRLNVFLVSYMEIQPPILHILQMIAILGDESAESVWCNWGGQAGDTKVWRYNVHSAVSPNCPHTNLPCTIWPVNISTMNRSKLIVPVYSL